MELVRGLHSILPKHHGCVLTIGNFDGVHLGHQAVLQQVKDKAKKLNLPAVVLVFEPQPAEFFNPSGAPARLTRWRDKYDLLQAHGIDRMICLRFDSHFAALSAEQFIQSLLLDKLGIKHLVIGDDFRFGKGRTGDFSTLKAAGEQFDFVTDDTCSCILEGVRISSTHVRQALACGNFELVEQLLGRAYSISGHVIHGDKKGRTIGFPTANILLRRCVSPVNGVFMIESVINGQCYQGIANVGTRPTISGQRKQLEVHFFDYADDLYGQPLKVIFKKKLREEQKFASFEALKAQITLDAKQAKAALEA